MLTKLTITKYVSHLQFLIASVEQRLIFAWFIYTRTRANARAHTTPLPTRTHTLIHTLTHLHIRIRPPLRHILHIYSHYYAFFQGFFHSSRHSRSAILNFPKGQTASKNRYFNENFKPCWNILSQKLKWAAGMAFLTENAPYINNGIRWRKAKRIFCDRKIPFKKLVVFDDIWYGN